MDNNDNNDNDSTSSNNNVLVQNLVDSFRDAFNSHDPKMLSSLLTDDGEWTDVIEHTMIGRNKIEYQHISFYYSVKRSKA